MVSVSLSLPTKSLGLWGDCELMRAPVSRQIVSADDMRGRGEAHL